MSSRKKWELDRRTVLKGLGTSIALPFLDAMVPSVAQAANGKTQRLVWIYMPLGNGARDYRESGIYGLPDILRNVIQPIRSETTVITNISVFPNAHWPGGPTGNAHPNAFVPYVNGGSYANPDAMQKTFDQHIADVNMGSKIRSIACTPQFWSVGDISDLHCNTMSYRGPNQPVATSRDPRELLNSLFSGSTGGGGAVDARVQDQLKRKRGILHYVMEDIKKVNAQVGKDDKIRIDEYLTGISDLEKNITAQLGAPTQTMTCEKPALQDPGNYPQRLQFFYDIIFHAFRCDLTRVATMMHGIEGGTGINHRSFISGMQTGADWHGLSHWRTPNYQDSSGNIEVNYQDLSKVINFHQGQIVNFVNKLKNTMLPTGGSLLDECAVAWGSSLSDSTTHDPRGLTLFVAGSANGALRKGQDVNLNNSACVGNFYLTLAQAFGANVNKIGQSNGTIGQLRT